MKFQCTFGFGGILLARKFTIRDQEIPRETVEVHAIWGRSVERYWILQLELHNILNQLELLLASERVEFGVGGCWDRVFDTSIDS